MEINISSDIASLKEFDKKVDKLNGFDYQTDNHSLTFSASRDNPTLKIDRDFPSEQTLDAYLLTLRMFIQKAEKISIRAISKIYSRLEISVDIKNRFVDVQEQLNNNLEKNASIVYNNKTWTRREVLYSILYGDKAHLDDKVKPNLKIWQKNEMIDAMIQSEFDDIVIVITNVINYIKSLNKEIYDELDL